MGHVKEIGEPTERAPNDQKSHDLNNKVNIILDNNPKHKINIH